MNAPPPTGLTAFPAGWIWRGLQVVTDRYKRAGRIIAISSGFYLIIKIKHVNHTNPLLLHPYLNYQERQDLGYRFYHYVYLDK